MPFFGWVENALVVPLSLPAINGRSSLPMVWMDIVPWLFWVIGREADAS